MRQSYDSMMGKFVNLENNGMKEIVDLIGSRTGLGEGLQLAKALINNYFEEDEHAQAILKMIEASVSAKKQERKNGS